MGNGSHRPLWVLITIVALTFGGLATILGVYLTDAGSSERQSVTLIGSILAFVAPTIAALLAMLRADEAKTTAKEVDQRLTIAHQENVAKLDHIEQTVNGTST